MTQVKDKTDQQLNRALAEIMGYRVEKIEKFHRLLSPTGKVGWAEISEEIAWNNAPYYCNDPAASLEVQAKAIEVDADEYVQNLAIVKWGEPDEDVEDVAVWNKTMRYSIAELLTASPRDRAEAAYVTLQGDAKC